MHLKSFCFLSVLFVCELSPVLCKQDLVKVSLYYESLCPFCRQFVTQELYPGYKKIKDFLLIDLVPFGKANVTKIDGNWEFKCQHGPKECLGNKIQACVLTKSFQKDSKIGFVYCMMNSSDPGKISIAESCASNNGILWRDIVDCVQGTQGDDFLAHYGDVTNDLDPKLTYVPHILFNGIFNATLEDLARDNFFKTVCGLFNTKPDACN
ncbi:gamma-interferon-inducible lysosomal thiol reductase-like [Tribolium madens]|uniref:gamma-interferon-inducible lysosomal thiol reductase-like n=1 Tax=Tribolium madens TaxID=41895 RepID=UPI001CF7244E|nr:gamma-interferon-inducible lysosomal thiol reductase-like [Tribolium madens]